MNRLYFLTFALILCVAINNDVLGKKHGRPTTSNDGGRIVGGYNTTIQDVPYQAYLLVLRNGSYYECGGSIIGRRHVLTAAHCLVAVTQVRVRIGSTNSQSGGRQYTTYTFTSHPLYNRLTYDYDVAIVRTRRSMTLDGVNSKAVDLPENGTVIPTGTELLVSGWGDTSENGNDTQYLMAVKVPTVSTEDCRSAYGESAITERMVCAGVPEGGKDSCQGDSGGPAVNDNGLQLGIVSFGQGCARPGYPGVYTNVSSVRQWIRTTSGV